MVHATLWVFFCILANIKLDIDTITLVRVVRESVKLLRFTVITLSQCGHFVLKSFCFLGGVNWNLKTPASDTKNGSFNRGEPSWKGQLPQILSGENWLCDLLFSQILLFSDFFVFRISQIFFRFIPLIYTFLSQCRFAELGGPEFKASKIFHSFLDGVLAGMLEWLGFGGNWEL